MYYAPGTRQLPKPASTWNALRFLQIAIIVAPPRKQTKPNQTKPTRQAQLNRSAEKQSERVGFHLLFEVLLAQILIQIQLLHHSDVCLFLI